MADGHDPNREKQLEHLSANMGFPRDAAMTALRRSNGNMDKAIEQLMKGEAPPPYSDVSSDVASAPPPSAGFNINATFEPPPYSKYRIDDTVKHWEEDSSAGFFANVQDLSRVDVRCSTCFDPIGAKERLVEDKNKTYHYECYMKTRGPKCSHCCRPLTIPDKERNLSGYHLVYHGNSYHVECYEKFAGPRCSYCFDVIIERPSENFSGQWIQDGSNMLHKECYEKKQIGQYRARLA